MTIENATGEVIEGCEVTLAMAKAEGWSTKSGSKWQTMAEQMLRYRAAAFLIRSVAPEIGMGLHTAEEILDTVDSVSVRQANEPRKGMPLNAEELLAAVDGE